MPAIHLLISGNVQGVFFRATAKEVADKLGIAGWIKNTRSGDVEALASGDEISLQSFVEWCKAGTEKARVDNVIVTQLPDEYFDSFSIIR